MEEVWSTFHDAEFLLTAGSRRWEKRRAPHFHRWLIACVSAMLREGIVFGGVRYMCVRLSEQNLENY